MCGIAAILLYPRERTPAQWRQIRALFTSNLVNNEARGRFATGAAVVSSESQVWLKKLPVPASEFVHRAEYSDLLDQLDSQTTLLLGHTRFPTKGDPAYAFNNHPIWIDPIIGIHNGEILNDDALFTKFMFHRLGQVDSEIIFQLLKLSHAGPFTRDDLALVQTRLRLLDGLFTFLACNVNHPSQLMVVTHGHPLYTAFNAELEILIFSSRYIFLRKLFGPPAITFCVENDRILLFDASELPLTGLQPVISLPLFGEITHES
jgi:glucosamine 6-phosphate synthetase-like amidotransferase/phosphosugar isomerase protein